MTTTTAHDEQVLRNAYHAEIDQAEETAAADRVDAFIAKLLNR